MPIHSIAEVIYNKIENLKKSIPPSVPSKNNKKKDYEKRIALTCVKGRCKSYDNLIPC